jgi:hypothetical protein
LAACGIAIPLGYFEITERRPRMIICARRRGILAKRFRLIDPGLPVPLICWFNRSPRSAHPRAPPDAFRSPQDRAVRLVDI